MHPALLNDDVLVQILECFFGRRRADLSGAVAPTDSVDRRALFNSSLVCTAFSTPALNILWRTLHSLHPLLKVLTNPALPSRPIETIDEIDDKNWARFQYYCQKVQDLTTEGNNVSEIASAQLQLRQKGLPLFPNLSGLFITLDPSTNYSEIALFLSPRIILLQLRDLRPITEGHSANTHQLLNQLLPAVWQTCRSIQGLLIYPEASLERLASSLFDSPLALLSMLYLIPAISDEQFSVISQMHKLIGLGITLQLSSDKEEQLFSSPSAGTFPNLTMFSFRASPERIVQILQRIESSSIHQLTLETVSKTSAWWSKISALLIEKWGHSLEILNMRQSKVYLQTPKFFRSSDRVPRLKKLDINGNFVGKFQDFGFLSHSAISLQSLTLGIEKAVSRQLLPRICQILPPHLEFILMTGMHNPDHPVAELEGIASATADATSS